MFKLLRITFWVIIFFTNLINAQFHTGITQKLNFKHYSINQGLSQSSVLCILQDSKGFLWFGTRDGLNKFDGKNFTHYRHVTKDSASLSNSIIKCLYEDDEG